MTELLALVVDELRLGNTANVKYKKVPDPVPRPGSGPTGPQQPGGGRPASTGPGRDPGLARAFALFAATQPRRGAR